MTMPQDTNLKKTNKGSLWSFLISFSIQDINLAYLMKKVFLRDVNIGLF